MRVMYIAPRYHTNQIPIITGWINQGSEVSFVARDKGPIEDYRAFEPTIVPYSKLFLFFLKIYTNIHKKNKLAFDINLKLGFPSPKSISSVIEDFNPDLVILREKSLYSMVCYACCKRRKIAALTYNQSPLYDKWEKLQREDFRHKLVDKLMPPTRYTPVRYRDYFAKESVRDKKAFFAPFVCELNCRPEDKRYFNNGVINVLMIGRFDRYKNHLLMIDAFKSLLSSGIVAHLVIVGECAAGFRKEYYEEVINHIIELGLQEKISVFLNVPFSEIGKYYERADLYVLPSTNETAAISILEAMSYSLPVITSSTNGTADYVEDGENGYIFKSDDVDDLTDKMRKIVADRERVKQFGAKSYEIAATKYQFKNYYDAIMEHI